MGAIGEITTCMLYTETMHLYTPLFFGFFLFFLRSFSLPPNVGLGWLLCKYIHMPCHAMADMHSSVHQIKLNIRADYSLNESGKSSFVIFYWVLGITIRLLSPICKSMT